MTFILPFHPETSSATIEIDGVTYRVPLVDSDGHLQVDVLNLADLSNALQSVGTDELRARIIANVLATDAATATNQATMITALQLIDDLRAALDAVQTDRLNVNVYRDGASEVKSAFANVAATSINRLTLLTPTSGKKVRIISVMVFTASVTLTAIEMYFGTGANLLTNAGSEILNCILQATVEDNTTMVWPEGGGPVGAVDEVVSIRTSIDIGINAGGLIHYREE
ncbi:hypothetical protein LCGC14_2298220 [marine sediment metagenome]|uniref:Uncharacterized protein n=1 Tax=marine sediment metagenome TaxID=412755 RepID=A0A0F9CP58_9ZZZZ